MRARATEPTNTNHVYILHCNDNSLYIGHTNNLHERLQRYNQGRGPTYTAQRLPVTLAHTEPSPTRQQAMSRERQLKGWTKAKN